MKCERLISLIKNWYLKVQEEAMAPARMVAFMEKHISQCEECLADPDVRLETEKIREIVLPPSKIPKPKVVRALKEDVEEDTEEDEEVDETSDDEDEDENEDEDVESDDEDEVDEDYDPDLMDDDDAI
jgi:Sec-independent protein translocase protein TatA